MSTETQKVDVLAQQFRPGQRVKYGEFDAVIREHYFESLWNVRLPGGAACLGAHELVAV